MPIEGLVQIDHRGLNLRLLMNWQDGDGGPVDGQAMPGVVRVKFPTGDAWDLSGPAADRFRAAIRDVTRGPGHAPPGDPDRGPPRGRPMTQIDPDEVGEKNGVRDA